MNERIFRIDHLVNVENIIARFPNNFIKIKVIDCTLKQIYICIRTISETRTVQNLNVHSVINLTITKRTKCIKRNIIVLLSIEST